jgi:hypothetical protein
MNIYSTVSAVAALLVVASACACSAPSGEDDDATCQVPADATYRVTESYSVECGGRTPDTYATFHDGLLVIGLEGAKLSLSDGGCTSTAAIPGAVAVVDFNENWSLGNATSTSEDGCHAEFELVRMPLAQ